MFSPGGSTPLYKPYRYLPPHQVGFLCRFGLKTGIHFAHFVLESGMVFRGTTECINAMIVSIPNELKRKFNKRILGLQPRDKAAILGSIQ